jgi:acyl-coenzyme A synthetase/AMP-(fatty) acid ligase
VVGRPHPIHGEEPIAFVVAASDTDAADLPARLAQRCAQSLSRHKRPVEIIVTESLPTGPTGKVKRAALRPVRQMA